MIRSIQKILSNFINSINGFKVVLKEHSFKAEIIIGITLIPFLIIINTSDIIKILIIVIYFLLLAFELLNTAIEKLSDKITKNFDEDIKKIKDISSASVFVILSLLIVSLILTIFVFT